MQIKNKYLIMNVFKIISKIYWTYFKSNIEYARHIGVRIGNGCFIATRNWSSEPYLISIGNNVQITDHVFFHTHGGAHVARRRYPQFDCFGKITINDWVYIGSGSHIMPGVSIGEGSLIAASSVVTKSVPANEVWGGNPARRICSVDEYIIRNLKYNVDSKDMTSSDKRKILLQKSDDAFIKK